MKRRVYVPLLIITALVLAGCASSTTGGDGGGTGADGSGEGSGEGAKIGLVTDQGGLNDRSFNALANKGLQDAESELGVQGDVLESKSASDYEPNLGRFAQGDYALVLGIGFLMDEAVRKVAKEAPDQNFAIIDVATAENPVDNIRGLLFKEQEAGYLAGALAGLAESDGKMKGLNQQKVVSVVGGQKIPPVDRYIAGFQAGVKEYCKECKVLVAYSNDFVDQSKCKEQALTQIGQGSDIVFQVAGACGLGALDAAKSKGVWGIGVDADQASLGPHILTSAIKKVDVAVFDTIESVVNDSFDGGTDSTYGLAEDGVGLGTISPAAEAYTAQIDEISTRIKAGEIDIPEEVK